MAQPTPYTRQFNFTDQQTLTPTTPLPATEVDAEFNAVKITSDQTLANLELIQRDDGGLRNGVVTQDSLADDLSIGFTFRGEWGAGIAYAAADGVSIGAVLYKATEAHTSSAPTSPDIDPVTWTELANLTPLAIGTDSVDTAAIQALAVTEAKLANNAVSNAKLAQVATATMKGRASGGTGAVEDLTAAQVLTLLNITSGVKPSGRLTLTSGVAVPESDVSAATIVYWTPTEGDFILLYDGASFVPFRSAELALTLTGAAHLISKNYDVFAALDAGVPKLGTGPAWSTDLLRGTGAGTTEIETFGGYAVNKNSITLTNNGATFAADAREATLLGTFRANVAGQARDTLGFRCLSNVFNATLRPIANPIATANWNYSGTSFQISGGGATTNGVFFTQAVGGRPLTLCAQGVVTTTDAAARPYMGIGIDSNTVDSSQQRTLASHASASQIGFPTARYRGTPGIGQHAVYGLEAVVASLPTQTWYGGTAAGWQAGLLGEILI